MTHAVLCLSPSSQHCCSVKATGAVILTVHGPHCGTAYLPWCWFVLPDLTCMAVGLDVAEAEPGPYQPCQP